MNKKILVLKNFSTMINEVETIDVFQNEFISVAKEIDISFNDYLYISYVNDEYLLYSISGNSKLLFFKYGKEFIKTELFNELSKKQSKEASDEIIKKSMYVLKLALYYVHKLNSDLNLLSNRLNKSKNYQIIKEKDNGDFKIKDKNNKAKIKLININQNEYFSVNDNNNKVEVTANNHLKKKTVIPSTYYPLPNNNEYKIFTHKNTKPIIENFNELFKNIDIKIGHCYSNCDSIYQVLKPILKDRIKYFSGWVCRLDHITHHAWIVIDDCSIIDASILKRTIQDEKCVYESLNNGKSPTLNSNNYIEVLNKYYTEDINFSNKYIYGEAPDLYVYVGVESNSNEAKSSFNNLLSKHPEHPDYQNIASDGSNKTQRKLNKLK